MNHTFTTKLFGLTVEVSGSACAGEPATIDCPASEPEFEIEMIEHEGCEFDIDSIPDGVLICIDDAALKSMKG